MRGGGVLYQHASQVNNPGARIAVRQASIDALVAELHPVVEPLWGWSKSKLIRRITRWWDRQAAIAEMRAGLTYADPTGNTAAVRVDDQKQRKKRR